MRVSECVECEAFGCADVKHNIYVVPRINLNPEAVSIVMVSESSPKNADVRQGISLPPKDWHEGDLE
jgi:hypothetical protein